MTLQAYDVTYRRRRLDQDERPIAPILNEYVGIVEYLREANILEEIPDRLRLDRTSGYDGFDLITALLVFVSCIRAYPSLGKLCYFVRRFHNRSVAGIVGRKDFPSQPSMSRMFAVVENSQVDELERWLLIDALDGSALWNDESVLHRDCTGHGWHVFSFDHTSTVLRLRALPEGPDLPHPNRHTDGFAKAGYPGRKRGQVMVSRGTLQHRGTRLWHGLTLGPGNGDFGTDLSHAANCIEQWAERAEVDIENCIVVVDGAHRGWPQVDVLGPMSLSYVTRLAHYGPLEDPGQLSTLLAAPWTRVRDSLSGPKRWAREMGTIEREGRTVRLVITRFQPANGKKHGAGKLIDGWQCEVFATDLQADQWPAAEVVTLYYARCGEENDFAREDAALDLDHVAHFELPGQRLFNLVGLWLWNLRILRGMELQGGLQTISCSQGPREVTVEQPEVDDTEKCDPTPSLEPPFHTEPVKTNSDKSPDAEVHQSSEAVQSHAAPSATEQLFHQLVATLEARFENKAGWMFDSNTLNIWCPDNRPLKLHQSRPVSDRSVEVRFRGLQSQCSTCPLRTECSSSATQSFTKEITTRIALPPESVEALLAILSEKAKPSSPPRTPPRLSQPIKRGFSRISALQAPDPNVTPGPLQMRQPYLVVAVLVNLLLDYTLGLHIHVQTTLGQVPVALPKYYTMTDADRQKRRHTWAQRHEWNALPEGSKVNVDIGIPGWFHPNGHHIEGARAA